MITRVSMQLAAMLIGLAMLFPALSASASQQALVQITYKSITANSGAYPTRAAGSWFATVNTTAGTPTPSVMWPKGGIKGNTTFTTTSPYLPFLSSMLAWSNLAATLQKSHPGVAPTGGSVMPRPTTTTKCFASIPPFAPGGPALAGSCFPRAATGARTPGAKKYGGTARLLQDTVSVGTAVAFTPTGYSQFSVLVKAAQSPALAGPDVLAGNYGLFGTGTFTNTALATARKTQNQATEAPFTTGVATAMGGGFGTALSSTGSFALNTTNLTGMISMVKPLLTLQFSRNQAGQYIGLTNFFATLNRVEVTFMPEPAVTLLLSVGVLGLGGLAGLRRR